ncbi:MAG: zinc-binding dehydrogenase [Vampirovibrionales bacterium]
MNTPSFSLSLPSTYQSMQFYAPYDVRYESVALPTLQSGEVLVRIGTALTCGTDLKCYRRGHPVLLGQLPSPFGHEFAGTVAAVAEDVTQWQVGDRVVAVNSAPCGECFYCQKQQPNLCETLVLLNGAYADYIVVPANIAKINMHRLPETLPFEVAAFTEPLAVAMRGVLDMGLQAGDHIAIIGVGPIGQLMVKVASLSGFKVTVLARNEAKLAMARRFGGAIATVNIANGIDAPHIVAQYSPEGRGFDAVIEAVGLPEVWESCVSLVRRGGKVHWFAGCAGGSTITLETRRLHYDEITLYSLFHHTPAFVKQAFDWLATGFLDPTPLITDTLPLPQLETALQQMQAGQGFKYALVPEASSPHASVPPTLTEA